MASSQLNALDQQLDIAGSEVQDATRTLTDETSFLGAPTAGQTGAVASVSGFAAGVSTLSGLTGMTAASKGRFLTVSGADTAGNNGTFLILTFNSATSVDIANTAGASPDANDGSIVWAEREPYSLRDDLDFERTDRTAIKGVNYDAAIPTYDRPTAVGTQVPANLSNIASKTTDARTLVGARLQLSQTASRGDAFITLASPGVFQHSDAVDRIGVPIFDGADAGDHEDTYVEIRDSATGDQLLVRGKATGSITAVLGSAFVDGETFTLDDGANPAVIFEFDDDSSVVETATLRAVPFTGAESAADMATLMVAAVRAAPTLDIFVFAVGSVLSLIHQSTGVAGNVTITTTVVDGGFVVVGMSEGSANAGQRIFGRSRAGGSVEPNSVEVEFRSVSLGSDISSSVSYLWESQQPTLIDLLYPYRERLDLTPEEDLRTSLVQGLQGSADFPKAGVAAALSYDNDGNLIRVDRADGSFSILSYSVDGLLEQVTGEDALGGSISRTLTYDDDDLLVEVS